MPSAVPNFREMNKVTNRTAQMHQVFSGKNGLFISCNSPSLSINQCTKAIRVNFVLTWNVLHQRPNQKPKRSSHHSGKSLMYKQKHGNLFALPLCSQLDWQTEISNVRSKLRSIARAPSQRARSASPAQRSHSVTPSETAIPTNRGTAINTWAAHSSNPDFFFSFMSNEQPVPGQNGSWSAHTVLYDDQLTRFWFSIRLRKADRRSDSPIPSATPLTRSGSVSKKASLLKTSSVRVQVTTPV